MKNPNSTSRLINNFHNLIHKSRDRKSIYFALLFFSLQTRNVWEEGKTIYANFLLSSGPREQDQASLFVSMASILIKSRSKRMGVFTVMKLKILSLSEKKHLLIVFFMHLTN